MATTDHMRSITLVAQAAVTQYTFVRPNAVRFGCIECTADTDLAVGIAQDAAGGANQEISVAFSGVAKLALNGTVTIGAALTSDIDGRGKVAAAGDVAQGIALEAGVQDDVISVLVLPSNRLIA